MRKQVVRRVAAALGGAAALIGAGLVIADMVAGRGWVGPPLGAVVIGLMVLAGSSAGRGADGAGSDPEGHR